MNRYHLKLPLLREIRDRLNVGDEVFISGRVYGMRDQAHKKIIEMIKEELSLPIVLHEGTIFYVGPTPPKPGEKVGAVGPTTSTRMDPFTPLFISMGIRVMIGKGKRSSEVIEAIKKYKAIYLVTPGGISAYLSQFVDDIRLVAFPELGPEAIYELSLNEFPTFVGIDTGGNSL
ncbi:MAG: FumA C-terminus/TtdB family hydratase beta subunit [bacterium]